MVRFSRVAPEVPVSDLNTALVFYENKLGFQLQSKLPTDDYAVVQRDGVAVHLFQDAARQFSPVGLHIFTDELDELEQELLARGAPIAQGIMRKPWGSRDFRVKDNWGNLIKFTEPVAEES